MRKIISIKNLTKNYLIPVKQPWWRALFIPKNRTIVAVDNISFEVKAGESVALLGSNGAGKTTTMKMLSGLLYPTKGSLKILGFTPTERKSAFLKQIALVMGNKTSLSWDLSPNQNFELFISMYDLSAKKLRGNIEKLARLLSVESYMETPVRKLSLGQRMKFELIGAILHQPKAIFLDEPTIGLDVVAKRNIRNFLRSINKKLGTTIVLTSHDMADIEQVCDRVIIINGGRIIFDDGIEKLALRYKKKKYLTVTFAKKIPAAKMKPYGQIIDSKEFSHILATNQQNYARVIAAISEKFPVEDIDIRSVPLDEIMEDMFR